MKNLWIFLLLFLIACSQKPKSENEISESQIDNIPEKKDVYQSPINDEEKNDLIYRDIDTTLIFEHKGIKMELSADLYLGKNGFFSYAENNDTLYVYLGMSNIIKGLKLLNGNKTETHIYQSYQTQLGINYDSKNPSILENWKSYQSDWQLIKNENDIVEYTRADDHNFPDYTKSELIEAIESNYSYDEYLKEWFLENVDNMLTTEISIKANNGGSEPYLASSITKTVFKIEDVKTKTTLFYIVLYHSLGC